MSDSLRRSSRRAKKVGFKVGDVVEITKGGIILKGKLTSQVESSQSNQPRWRISYEDEVFGDEELSEASLGHILTGNSDNETSSPTQAPAPVPPPSPSPASVAAATAARKKNRKNGRFVKTNPFGAAEPSATTTTTNTSSSAVDSNNKKAVSFTNTPVESDSSAPSQGNKKSAREQRTARRNKNLPEIGTMGSTPTITAPVPKKRPPQPGSGGGSSNGGGPKSKKAKGAIADEEVVKVPMLTGTLYLYKGIRRRAEFVRKY